MGLLIAAYASLAAWLWLTFAQGMFWRTDVRLPPRSAPARWPSVAIVVPARDEAEVLPLSLPSLLAQDYPGEAGIVLVDDGSSDGTAALAARLAAEQPGLPLTVVSPGDPPPGWTGKLWAVRHGIAHVRTAHTRAHVNGHAHEPAHEPAHAPAPGTPEGLAAGAPHRPGPEFLLLTDADIAHEPDSLRELVAAATSAGLDLVSQMARLRVVSAWERLVVPAFVYFFAQLYPFRRINRPGARTSAAAGGCVLLRTEAAVRAGIPDSIRQAVIDDVALARAVRRGGGRIWLGLAERVDSVRPYSGLGDLWRMVSRSAYAQLRHRPVLLAGTVAGLVLVYLVPPAALCAGLAAGRPAVAWAGGTAWLLMTGTYLPMLRYYRQSPLLAPLLPLTALLYLLMTVDSAVRHYRGRGAAWKGRTYARPGDV
ncbi:glycosyltransferase [Streptomyces sp. SPB4]|uniref:glycosyltransferase n=1 Tax=Streptomyces sp. SPB4 TaxID=2940553 RepID=UPI00247429D3|nr:glycosyltransferase [Streptomyces sp. SPB4]MDH6539622.1 glycosyltransferase involved in cell wall biosynthesis [Streptomyces sp. SPB4]